MLEHSRVKGRGVVFLFLIPLIILSSCSLFKSSTEGQGEASDAGEDSDKDEKVVEKPQGQHDEAEAEKDEVEERAVYHPSPKRVHDLVHTVLDVSFDLQKRYLQGKAEIELSPHFYPTDSLTLDAQGFDIHKVALVTDTGKQELGYEYDGQELHLELDSTYTRRDSFRVHIDYTAKPAELDQQGSQAISSAQGLYFIDPKDEDPDKPTQIWTQGETEHNSAWFPTIDAPNQKMSQEISITVPKRFKTLSNGSLQYSIQNGDGTRTDHWKQELPHPPYLTMMAVGDYAVVEDQWKDLPVNYYVEPEYKASAKDIFGKTPEMIEFYSDTLNFEYPWAKYDQVVVRDFVSGAMENTSATVHGSMQRKTSRELIDGDNEATIAHELIHHWFGNIVTCESWANLPLNEAFATYGEYLWEEHAYGREDADKLLQEKLNTYLGASRRKQVDLIRYDYERAESMFDAFSYHKGGCILHMLRKQVGNEAFFASLEKYLKDNAYQPVEVHELRLAFEAVTGEDLNWFFDQWFLNKGHPVLDISYAYDSGKKVQQVIVRQEQDLEHWPLYKLPVKVDLYYGDKTVRRSVTIDASVDSFSFSVDRKPDLVNVDAQKMLLCRKNDHKSTSAYIHQYDHAPLYLDRYEAVAHCAGMRDSLAAGVILRAMKDDHYRIRQKALQNLRPVIRYYPEQAKERILAMARSDAHPPTRASAVKRLKEYYPKEDHTKIYERALKDSSFMNVARGLRGISKENPERGKELASKFEDSESGKVLVAVGKIYAEDGSPGKNAFFIKTMKKLSGASKLGFIRTYADYLEGQDFEAVKEGLPALEHVAIDGGLWYAQAIAIRSIQGILNGYNETLNATKRKLEKLREKEKDEEKKLSEKDKKERERLKKKVRTTKERMNEIQGSLDRIRKNVDNERVLRYLGGS